MNKRHPLRLCMMLAATVLLSSCLAAPQPPIATDLQPCWMETPVTGHQIGQVGLARNIAYGNFNPLELGKMRAIADLCRHQGRLCDDDELQAALESQQLAGQTLYFDQFEKAGYVYAFAGFYSPSEDQCPVSACNITECDPSWLCNPSENSQNGLLGVSYRATSPFHQYNKAVANALLQAQYLFGASVSATKDLRQSRINGENFSILVEKGNVGLGNHNVPFYVARQCHQGSSLYRQVVIGKDFPKTINLDPTDTQWLQNPKYKGLDGAIGVVEKPAASGLASDQIKLAIKQAAIQLAFEKNSRLREDSLSVTYDTGGLIQINNIKENTNTSLKAQVISIHFAPGLGPFLKVTVWVALV